MLTVQLIDKLLYFENQAKPADFVKAFGNSLGAHLWDKFVYQYDHNLLRLCRWMDSSTLEKLVAYLNSWET